MTNPSDESAAMNAQAQTERKLLNLLESFKGSIDPNGDGLVSRREVPSAEDRDLIARHLYALNHLTPESARVVGGEIAADIVKHDPQVKKPYHLTETEIGRYAAALLSPEAQSLIQNLPRDVELDDAILMRPNAKLIPISPELDPEPLTTPSPMPPQHHWKKGRT